MSGLSNTENLHDIFAAQLSDLATKPLDSPSDISVIDDGEAVDIETQIQLMFDKLFGPLDDE